VKRIPIDYPLYYDDLAALDTAQANAAESAAAWQRFRAVVQAIAPTPRTVVVYAFRDGRDITKEAQGERVGS
jgi:hypothetical protein